MIMNRDLTAYGLQGQDCIDYYNRNKDLHLNPQLVCYGDVLVKTKDVFSGISFRLKLYFRNHWYWKPSYHWKHGYYYFHWLFFMIWFDKEYIEVFDKIIKDHLSDFLKQNNNK